MKTFDSIKHYFEVLGITSSQSTRKDLFKLQNVIFFVVLSMDVISASVFGYYEANSFEQYVDSFYTTSSAFICFYTYGILFWELPHLYRFIQTVESTIDGRLVHPASKQIYTKPDQQFEKLNGILEVVLVKVIPLCVVLPKLITSFLMCFTTDLGNEAFELPVPGQWFPFDWKNPIGYTMAIFIQYVICLIILIGVLFLAIFKVGSVMMLILMTRDLKCNLKSINRQLKSKENRNKMAQHFLNLVKFHSGVKQLIKDFSEPLRPVFVAIFAWSTWNISSTMLLIRMLLANSSVTVGVIYRMDQVFSSFALVFIVCEFGHRVSSAFEQTNHAIGKLNWYLFPIETWKSLPIVIAGVHQPIVITVFGSVSCSRMDFRMAVNSGYSYYMFLGRLR